MIELLGFQPVLFLDSQCFGPGAALPAHLQDRQRGFRRLVWVGSESSGVEAGRVSERKRISFLVHPPDNACKGLHYIDVRCKTSCSHSRDNFWVSSGRPCLCSETPSAFCGGAADACGFRSNAQDLQCSDDEAVGVARAGAFLGRTPVVPFLDAIPSIDFVFAYRKKLAELLNSKSCDQALQCAGHQLHAIYQSTAGDARTLDRRP